MPTRLADTGRGARRERRVDPIHVERAERLIEHEHPEQEARVADPVGDERLLAGARLVRVLEPEADQKIRREAHAFPADEEHEERPAEDQQQHEEQEEIQVREVARVALVVLHVSDRVDVDQRADAGHDQRHHGAQTVEVERDLERVAAGGEPRVGEIDPRRPSPACRSTKHLIATANAAIGKPQPIAETNRGPSRLPAKPFSRKPASGRRTITVSSWVTVYPLRSV
jgi:hypothetical protein